MNTTASFLPETSWSRRCSTETVFSIQGRETDVVQDSSDSEWCSEQDEEELEYEPVTESDEEALISEVTSGQSDAELVSRKVVPVAGSEGDLQLADSEQSLASESEPELPRYRCCARCRGDNDNSRYRYCDKCFQLKKNFFPPRPRRKGRQDAPSQEVALSASSQDVASSASSQESGIGSLNSQELTTQDALSPENVLSQMSQDSGIGSLHSQEIVSSQEFLSQGSTKDLSQNTDTVTEEGTTSETIRLGKLKRRSESADRIHKRIRKESGSDRESGEVEVAPLVKTNSDPAVTIETLDGGKDNLCIICLTEPKSGVFVHRRVAHICCCYTCAVKVWSKARRCPICNCKVSNVLKAVVM